MSASGGFESGGLGGRPTLPTGEPVLQRWFVIFLLVLVPIGLGITAWAFLAFNKDPLPAAARRPPGDVVSTHDRGLAVLSETQDVEVFDGCIENVRLVGDEGGLATARRAMQAACFLRNDPDIGPEIQAGLIALGTSGGAVRVAVFEATGVDASTRIEDGAPVIEINAKFQFDDAARAAPALVHELVHLGRGWPRFGPVDASEELAAIVVQGTACERLEFPTQAPRTCLDADELLMLEDPLRALVEAGYLN